MKKPCVSCSRPVEDCQREPYPGHARDCTLRKRWMAALGLDEEGQPLDPHSACYIDDDGFPFHYRQCRAGDVPCVLEDVPRWRRAVMDLAALICRDGGQAAEAADMAHKTPEAWVEFCKSKFYGGQRGGLDE